MTIAQQLLAAETGTPAQKAVATRRLNQHLKTVEASGGNVEASRRAIKANVTRLRAQLCPTSTKPS